MRHLTRSHRRNCRRKTKFGSEHAAAAARRAVLAGDTLDIYRCRAVAGTSATASERARRTLTRVRRMRLDGPVMRLTFACADMHELRKGGSSVTPDARQRVDLEAVLSEVRYWLDYGE